MIIAGSPRVSQHEGLVRHHHPLHVDEVRLGEYLRSSIMVKTPANVVSQVVISSTYFSNHRDELVGDRNK